MNNQASYSYGQQTRFVQQPPAQHSQQLHSAGHQQQHTPHQPHSLNPQPPQLSLGQSSNQFTTRPPYSNPPQAFVGQSSSFGPSRSDASGSRPNGAPSSGHRREPSGSTAGASSLSRSTGAGPYTRPSNQIVDAASLPGPAHPVKASSTTSEFTKRKNWSQHIIDEIQDFMHLVSPSGKLIVASPSIEDLSGWKAAELVGQSVSSFVHPDDLPAYEQSFADCLGSHDPLTIYYRFRTKDGRYLLLEVTGHAYYPSKEDEREPSLEGSAGGGAKCFFGMARPYPSKNQAMLDSFLELKVENERLRQELLLMYNDIDNNNPINEPADGRTPYGAIPGPDAVLSRLDDDDAELSPRAHDLALSSTDQAGANVGETGYGALGISLGNRFDGANAAADKNKKKKLPKPADEGEFVCRDCGTVDSPEWRKGPEGAKTLCNACGLRYAKVRSKENKLAKAGAM